MRPRRRENAEDVARDRFWETRVTRAPNSESGDDWVGRRKVLAGEHIFSCCAGALGGVGKSHGMNANARLAGALTQPNVRSSGATRPANVRSGGYDSLRQIP